MLLKKLMKRRIYSNIFIILSFILLSFLSILWLYNTHTLFGASDMPFHLKRIAELRMSILHGIIFPRFSLNEFNGSSIMTMYPYINLMPLILLSFIIKSGIKLMYIYFFINTAISFIISYYSCLNYNSDKLISYFFSLFYCTSTLYLDYEFLDMDLGALSAIILLPLVIFGCLKLINNNNWIELSFGMTLILLSHILSAIIISSFLAVLILINFNKINIKMVKNLCKSIFLTVFTTCIFLIPFFHLSLLNMNNMLRPDARELYGTSFKETIIGALFGNGTYSISIIPIFGVIFSIILFKHLKKIDKQMFILSVLILIVCSNVFPWNLINTFFKVFTIFQFTWRLYIIPQMLLCYISAIDVFYMYKNIKIVNIGKIILVGIIFITMSFQFISQVNISHNSYDNDFTNSFINKNTINFNHPMKQYAHHKLIYVSGLSIPHGKNVKEPPYYKVNSQQEYNNLISPYNTEDEMDYYPLTSRSRMNFIVNNYAFNKNYYVPIKYNGYNTFLLNNRNNNINDIYLPLVKYNGESMNIKINNHWEKPLSNSKYGLIELNHIKRGVNHIRIKINYNKFGIYSEFLMFIIGMLVYISYFCKHYIE